MEVRPHAAYDAEEEVLAISGPGYYLRIAMSSEELLSLRGVREASWDARRSIRAGTALGNPVHWCRSSVDRGAVSVLVGADDETWEVALELPADVLLRVVPAS